MHNIFPIHNNDFSDVKVNWVQGYKCVSIGDKLRFHAIEQISNQSCNQNQIKI